VYQNILSANVRPRKANKLFKYDIVRELPLDGHITDYINDTIDII